MRELAKCTNVWVKLGGLGMVVAGFDFHKRSSPPGSAELADAWRPYIQTCIELFGASRCMFESNFPPDKGTCSYVVLWNAFKRIVAGASEEEKSDLFSRSAARFYRLDLAQF
jgi:predicted TIM-barrel fold metal-dependent hydrolase